MLVGIDGVIRYAGRVGLVGVGTRWGPVDLVSQKMGGERRRGKLKRKEEG